MANKNVAKKLLSANQSLAANFTTEPTNIENLDSIAWTISTSGVTDNGGSFSAQVRMKDAERNLVGDWIDIAFSPVPTLANVDTTIYCLATQLEATEARLKFVAVGTVPDGTAQIWVKSSRRGA